MSFQLTSGCLRRAFLSSDCTGSPVVQVLEIKSIKGQERYRLVLNDGEFYQQGMLATQLNHLVSSGQLKEWTVVKLSDFLCSQVSTRRVIVVLNMIVLGRGPPQAMGSPQNVELLLPGAQQAETPAAVAPLKEVNKPLPASTPSYLTKQSPFSSIAPSPSAIPQTFHPISSLNPYQNRWTIKARVTAKSDVRTWHNQRGEGKLFSIDLLDAGGGQIRATMFNDAVDKFEPIFRVDGIYLISKGQLKLANKNFSRIPNEYEITLNSDAEVVYIPDDNSIEQQKFTFASIEEIGRKEENSFIDVIGIVTSVSPLSSITAKTTQKQLNKRAIILCDNSQLSVEVTFWGEQAEKYNEAILANHPILAIKNVKISNFGGKTLGTTFQSQIFLNPDRKEAHELKHWWTTQGHSTSFNSLSTRMGGAGGGITSTDQRRPLSCIKDEQLGFKKDANTGETKGDYILVKGTVTNIRHDFNKPPWYYACPSCNKKVTVGHNGNDFWCEKCNKNYNTFDCRYVMSLQCADYSSATWLNAFNEQGAQILGGVQAKDILQVHQQGDEASFNRIFENALFKQFLFKIRVKAEMQQEEMKARCNIVAIQPIDFVQESQYLMGEIAKLAG